MKGLHKIAFILVIIGALNWGLEAFGWGIGNVIPAGLATIIYILVGLSAIVEILNHKSLCKNCEAKGSRMESSNMGASM